MNVAAPHPYAVSRVGSAFVVAAPHAADRVRMAVQKAGTLFAYAAGHPQAERLEGRGPLYSVPVEAGAWVIRHYRRGGAVARLLADRYLRVGTLRPLREISASVELRRRWIPTPAVVAVVLYPAGPFYRADIATVRVPCARDLAEVLFVEPSGPREERLLACRAAGDLLRRLAECGVLHGDLNAKNILLEWTAWPPRVHLVDLDRCRFVERVSPWQRERMLRRLRRSLRKWEASSGRPLEPREWDVLDQTFRGIQVRHADEPL
ncbi:MAG: hypothetical protein HY704_10000 [Gemmatimonadetes bacterium]|nr:hypothetical protein [Gemmatimonadota bacterium]